MSVAVDLRFFSACSISVSTLTSSGFLSSNALMAFLTFPSRDLTMSWALAYSLRNSLRSLPFSSCRQLSTKGIETHDGATQLLQLVGRLLNPARRLVDLVGDVVQTPEEVTLDHGVL